MADGKEPRKRRIIQIAAWVDPDLRERFQAIADKDNRSMSQQLGILVREHVEEREEQAA